MVAVMLMLMVGVGVVVGVLVGVGVVMAVGVGVDDAPVAVGDILGDDVFEAPVAVGVTCPRFVTPSCGMQAVTARPPTATRPASRAMASGRVRPPVRARDSLLMTSSVLV
jgi:hypothetical protein